MSRIVLLTTNVTVLAVATAIAAAPRAARQAPENDGKREFTLSGCLLRAGYAGYQMEGVTVEAIDGKAVPATFKTPVTAQKWTLQGGGNLGPRVGEKVQVIGRSDWQEKPAAAADEPPKAPALEVKAVKTVAASCS
jgi:hypothetical protein